MRVDMLIQELQKMPQDQQVMIVMDEPNEAYDINGVELDAENECVVLNGGMG